MKKIVPLLLTTAVLFSGCGSTKNNVNDTVKNVQSTQDVYIFAGKVQADNSVSIMSKISGKVSQISVDVGSKVNAGDAIINLDTQDIQAQINQAQAGVESAQAGLNKLQNSSRPEQIAAAQAAVQGAQQAYDVAQKNYDRQKSLLDSGAGTQVQLEQAQVALATVKTQYESSQQNLNILNNGPTQGDLGVAEAAVKQAQATVDTVKTQLNNAVITSPISGVVTAKNINVGEMATPGQPLITIVNSGQLHVDGYVPADLAAQLKVGQIVNVKASDVSDKTFEGEISVIDTQVNSLNKDVLVKATLKDGSDLLKPGMFTEIGLKK